MDIPNQATSVWHQGKCYWVNARQMRDNTIKQVFAFEDAYLEKPAKVSGKTLMFKKENNTINA